jgi:hypothetical protein
MHRFFRIARALRVALVLGLAWLAPLTVLAQTPATGGEEEKPSRSYVLGYALTTLCIGLGIFAVVKPGKRRYPKIKRKDEDEEVKPKH